MIKLLKKYKKSKLVKDNLILFISNFLTGALVFLFHFFIGRYLGPAAYSIIGVILSIVYIFNIPLTTIQTGIANFTANFNAKKKFKEINYLFNSSIKRLSMFGLICLIIFLALSPVIASYLKIKITPLFILSPFILFAFLIPIIRGIFQGLQKFKLFGLNLLLEGSSKFILGVFLIILGFNVNGAITAIVFSYILCFYFGYKVLKKIIYGGIKKFKTKEVYKYSAPILFMLTGLTALYTIDVILVKHFFTEVKAGYYVAISTLAKILFFGSYSVAQVMFPKVSELYTKRLPHKHLLYKSLSIMSIILLPAILIYFLFSKLIINIVYGQAYLEVSNLLGWFAIVMGLFSLIYAISFYNLSINKNKFIYTLLFFDILEIVLIYLFHDSLAQIIKILIFLMSLLFIIILFQAIHRKDGKTINNNSSI
jgi:O-antigen/teichoic acid export membrane protein